MFYYPHILTFWMYAVHCSIHNLDRTRFSTRRKFATARENLWLFYGIFAENCIISTSSKLNENQQTDAMQLPFNGCNNERGYSSVSFSLCSMLLYVWFIEFVNFELHSLRLGLQCLEIALHICLSHFVPHRLHRGPVLSAFAHSLSRRNHFS